MSDLKVLHGPGIRDLIRLALSEDAPFGDLSAQAAVPAEHQSSARVIARENMCFCGELFVPLLMREFDAGIVINKIIPDGTLVEDGTELLTLHGPTQAILQIERPLLNFLQRLSGVATKTHEVVSLAQGITILDTRKTIPGWRQLDKYAVRVGGGSNHRFSLSDMIMIKNNHIDANGGDIAKTLQTVRLTKPHYTPIQVEVRSLDELKKVIPFAPDAVLLDNMSDAQIKECLTLLKSQTSPIKLEVSGGITSERFPAFVRMGVSSVSLGSLTGDARNRDISLRIDTLRPKTEKHSR